MRQRESTVLEITLPVADTHVTLECDILVSGRYTVPEDVAYTHPVPHFNRVVLVTRGCCEIHIGDRTLPLPHGASCLLPVWCSFDARYLGGSEFVYFHVELVDTLGLDLFRHCPAPVCLTEPSWHELICRAYPGNTPWEDATVRVGLVSLLMRFAEEAVPVQVLEQQVTAESRYTGIMRSFRAHPDAMATVGQIADELGVSRHALSKGFHRATGIPLKQYLSRVVLERALRLLATTARTHCEIAEDLGFRDPAYFHRVFRRHFGEAPGEYRRKLRAGWYEPTADPAAPVRLGR
jgi:AraC-like DNA-binding protein